MTGTERDSEGTAGEPRKAADADPPPQAGVLGNLPKKRPAVRSPRRAEAKAKADNASKRAPKQAPKAAPEPTGTPQRDRKPPRAASAGERTESPPEHSAAADLEGLARGGIAIAGGAASLGLRVAGRAAAALRDAVERR
ncbi:MAG: hypothetical protein U0R51_07080 [Solirubrobacterales bacterium]